MERLGAAEVHALAQSDPTGPLTARLGTLKMDAQRQVESLAKTLRDLDDVVGRLGALGLKCEYDLGPVGNAASAARRDRDKKAGDPRGFSLGAER